MDRYSLSKEGFTDSSMERCDDGDYVYYDTAIQAIATARADALKEARKKVQALSDNLGSGDGIMTDKDRAMEDAYDLVLEILADKQEPRLTLVCDQCGRIEHEPYEEGDHCWTGCGRFRIKDKQESTCPACGRSWDVSRFNSCECGASLADKQEEK